MKREQFSSSLGFVLAAAGSAVGIGNLVAFPVMASKNGGAAFLIIYAFFVFLEFSIFLNFLNFGYSKYSPPQVTSDVVSLFFSGFFSCFLYAAFSCTHVYVFDSRIHNLAIEVYGGDSVL